MKKSALLPPLAALAVALSLAGCFGGEESGTTPVKPQDTTKVPDTNKVAVKQIKPGFYEADYSPYDTAGLWESEFTLNQDGTYRLYWIRINEALADFKGNWFQRDSALYFHTVGETYMDNSGFFAPHSNAENDTNAIMNITDTSFTRKEWTMLRQKPYWVTYKLRSPIKVDAGAYEYTQTVKIDSVTNMVVKIRITLTGTGFNYSYNEDTLELFQAEAKWYQLGSILGTEDNRGRNFVDSTKTFAPWDTLPGALLQRIHVSDTAFEMWYPGGFATPPRWDVYRKVD